VARGYSKARKWAFVKTNKIIGKPGEEEAPFLIKKRHKFVPLQ